MRSSRSVYVPLLRRPNAEAESGFAALSEVVSPEGPLVGASQITLLGLNPRRDVNGLAHGHFAVRDDYSEDIHAVEDASFAQVEQSYSVRVVVIGHKCVAESFRDLHTFRFSNMPGDDVFFFVFEAGVSEGNPEKFYLSEVCGDGLNRIGKPSEV